MAKMHSYDVGNQSFRLDIHAKIALFTFITILLADSFKSGSFDLKFFLAKYGWSISLVTITFIIFHKLYDRFLWSSRLNILNKTPNLSGTWVGFAINSQFKPMRLELMKITQTWSNIGIVIEVYEGSEGSECASQEWVNSNKIGTEYSTSTRITECDLQDCFCEFIYHHKGKANGQPEFNGLMSLTYTKKKTGIKKPSITLWISSFTFLVFKKVKQVLQQEKDNKDPVNLYDEEEIYRLDGEYANTKKGRYVNNNTNSEEDYDGLSGRIFFHRVSPRIVEKDEVFKLNGINEVLSKLKQEINYDAQRIYKI